MSQQTEQIFKKIVNELTTLKGVSAIGLSRGKEQLPNAGEGDIDLFIYCSSIPSKKARVKLLEKLSTLITDIQVEVADSPFWGSSDFFKINGVETWLMFFTEQETEKYIQAVLRGAHLDKVDNYFYPVGRCAMLHAMWVLHDPFDFLRGMKQKLSVYPEDLLQLMLHYHLKDLHDTEDLQRAVLRKDVLFYHFALDLALDHFLLALFALNKQYFPSRKRSLQYISTFSKKPTDCEKKLLEVVKLGASDVTLEKSYRLWSDLVLELQELCNYMVLLGEYVP